MPTYYAAGVTATLATCDLQVTLPKNVYNFRQGSERKVDVAKVQEAFSAGEKLPERPLGSDGIVQFIGRQGDMPFYVVEAGKNIDTLPTTGLDAGNGIQDALKEAAVEQMFQLPFLSDDSPLTSLGATPTTPMQANFSDSLFKQPPPVQLTMEALASLANEQALQTQLQEARNLSTSPNAQALVLDVQFADKSFLPEEKKGRLVGKDLKIEVFINGDLADVSIINAGERRRAAIQVTGDRARFSGTRVHRQVEKPWIYSQDAFNPDGLPGFDDAERRWNMVGSCYLIEAEVRGRNRYNDLSPSAEFLTALASQEFPRRVAARQRLAIIDVVITAGTGKKYGPETSYLMKPTRMEDRNYVRQKQTHLSGDVRSSIASLKRDATRIDFAPLDKAAFEHSLSAALHVVSPTPKRSVKFNENVLSEIDSAKMTIASHERSRGKLDKSGRNLRHRINDVKNRNPTNPDEGFDTLEDQRGAKRLPEKKLKMDHALDAGGVFAFGATAGLESRVDPTKLPKKTSKSLHGADLEAVLTQTRISMALNEGADSNGALVRRIASASPQHTPKRTTNASALARSPMCSPVKSSTRKGAPSATHTLENFDVDGAPVSDRTMTDSAKVDASPAANDTIATPRKKKSAEQSVSEVLKAFKIPDCCKGSCVSYDEDENVSRLIGKARGGEFKEETVLVGMRFVVN